MNKQRVGIALLAITLLAVSWTAPAQAQGGGWSEPYRLSSSEGAASEGYLVADQYGYVHCFWTETLFEGGRTVIKYARFDGTTWTKPNDIYVTGQGIRNVSPVVDQRGIMHITWSEGLYDVRAYYTYAPANEAVSAQKWAEPIQIDVPARPLYLRVDSSGILHVLYTDQTGEIGVYYTRSEDGGISWSEPVWLDPDILPDHVPDGLNFELDENDGLHAVWWYGGLNRARPDWVRYSHSLDGGQTWSEPFLIDKYQAESNHNLTSASPTMIVQGQTVHVIWAAGSLPYRHHRFSADAGFTWSAPVQIFGELHGQAGDGLAIDGAGRVHFFAQIRYPMGIYHAYWDGTRWSKPSLVYFIAAEGFEEELGDRVHAHFTLPVIRAGNQLVLTFTDPSADPNRRLFVMYRTLDDVLPLDTESTPVPDATATPKSSPAPGQLTPMPNQTATAPSLELGEVQPSGPAPAADVAIQVALIPTLLVLVGAMIFQLYKRKR